MSKRRDLQRAEEAARELIGSHDDGADLERFAEYRDDPVGFVREVLGEDPWSAQEEFLELVARDDVDRVSWRSGQSVGKSRAVAWLLLWWPYCRQGQAIISMPTARQARDNMMRKELARIWHRNRQLGGELYADSLRIVRDEPAVLAYTATSASGAQGVHDPEGGVLMVLDEAQDVPLPLWEALDANTTGRRDKQVVAGNPLAVSGPFWEVNQPDSGWAKLQTSMFDHPNLQDGHPRYIEGGPSEESLQRFRDRWDEGSAMWTARVDGEHPMDAVEGIYPPRLVDAAIERGRDDGWTALRADEEPVLGIDVARHGLDSSAAVWRRGGHVVGLETWSGASTTETVDRVKDIARRVGVRRDIPEGVKVEGRRFSQYEERPYGRIIVDELGVGAGVLDSLQDGEMPWPATGFKASRKAKDADRFRDAKAESYWRVRELLEEGALALPDDRMLREEMVSAKWSPDSQGRVQVESKDEIRGRIGRSPDRLDALTQLFSPAGTKRERVTEVVSWFGA